MPGVHCSCTCFYYRHIAEQKHCKQKPEDIKHWLKKIKQINYKCIYVAKVIDKGVSDCVRSKVIHRNDPKTKSQTAFPI